MTSGRWTLRKVAAIFTIVAAVCGIVFGYLRLAYEAHWPPFSSENNAPVDATASHTSTGISTTPASPVPATVGPITEPTPSETPRVPETPSPVNRIAIVSYDRGSAGSPYWGRSNVGYQAFTAASNTLTVVEVLWNNNSYTHGAWLDGVTSRVSICTGVSNDTCTGRIADGYAPIHNTALSPYDFGDIPVTPGAIYYVFYYQPTTGAGGWDLYWWQCNPSCPAAGRQDARLSDQNSLVVKGYNR